MREKITLVLLPGMDGTGLLFAPFVRALPDWVKPVVVAYPGDRPLDYAGHLELVMAALPVDGPFVILGESFSGPLALMVAARRPKGLRGVILAATFVTWPLGLPVWLARLAVSCGVFRAKSTRLFLRIVLGKNATVELKGLFPAALARLTPEVLAARARAVMAVNCTEELRSCHVPVLTLVAERDRIVGRRSPELMQQVRPDLELARFDSPHLILQLATDEAVERICRFLAGTRDREGQVLMRTKENHALRGGADKEID
jgi:pimeloyl-[acyl-carrier protein] methyl ester esterase